MIVRYGVLLRDIPTRKQFFLPGNVFPDEISEYVDDFIIKMPMSEDIRRFVLLVTDYVSFSWPFVAKLTYRDFLSTNDTLTYKDCVERLLRASLFDLSLYMGVLEEDIKGAIGNTHRVLKEY